jgi:hypothetical protein
MTSILLTDRIRSFAGMGADADNAFMDRFPSFQSQHDKEN